MCHLIIDSSIGEPVKDTEIVVRIFVLLLFSFQCTLLISPRGGMSSAMYGWGGEAFFCPRRLPSRENARGERWPYAGAPLTIRIYVERQHSPYTYTYIRTTHHTYTHTTYLAWGHHSTITALPLNPVTRVSDMSGGGVDLIL